ncbi:MAG: M23 family metallopeptidase [bacterium]
MRDKKFKIIYFSLSGSQVKQLELSWGKFFSLLLATFIIVLLLASSTIAVFTNFYHSMKIASLTKLNAILTSQLTDMGRKAERIEKQLEELEQGDDNLRIVADLPRIDQDVRNVGVGGFLDASSMMPAVSREVGDQILEYQQLLDKMERRIELTKASREEIKDKLEYDRTVFKHTPSIRPLLGGRIRDKYGFRLDPFTEKIKHHDGIDIAAERGTEIFATASGVVEKVVTKYKVGRSYGKQVIINHGYGFKTRYGHLSKVLVRKGQKIGRWTPIGLVGDTGRATGPHLHYEVILDGKPRDPLRYILD